MISRHSSHGTSLITGKEVKCARMRASQRSGVYRLDDERVVSFGGTLEWYVAQVLAREFECASAHGLRIAHAAHGGDYDVIACTEGEVVYVETKSAPPRQIVQAEVGAFLDRV